MGKKAKRRREEKQRALSFPDANLNPLEFNSKGASAAGFPYGTTVTIQEVTEADAERLAALDWEIDEP